MSVCFVDVVLQDNICLESFTRGIVKETLWGIVELIHTNRVIQPTTIKSFTGKRSKSIRTTENSVRILALPKPTNNSTDGNIYMALYSEDSLWYPCRVLGVSPKGTNYSIVEYLGYDGGNWKYEVERDCQLCVVPESYNDTVNRYSLST